MYRQMIVVAVVASVAAMAVPLVSGDHFYPGFGGSSIMFDHRGGNEWWVEVAIVFDDGGNSSLRVDSVQARDEGDSTWHALTLRSWGTWAASFRIEPGHKVQFRAAQNASGGGEVWNVTSAWFTHPQGVEQNGGGGDFTASFYGVKGNEWWLETYVTSTQGIASVKASLDNGSWQPMTLRSWGSWATSLHAVEGTIVRFAAYNGTGAEALSGCYRWTAATPTACNFTPPPPPTPTNATFDHKGGNEWWVEAKVTGTNVTTVQARDANSPWTTLTLRSWGNHAGSFHIEPGNRVMFRAAVDGYWWESAWFTHPAGLTDPGGQQVSPGVKDGAIVAPPSTFSATFSEVQCSEWWQQVHVTANQPIAGVDVRANGTDWRPLTLQSWGDWAKSTHVLPGQVIQFRARNATGAYDFTDGGYVCPGAAPYPPAGGFDARFANVQLLTNWTQVNVYANRALTGVDVNVNNTTWQALARQAWGDWAAAIDVPLNATAQFRAVSDAGTVYSTNVTRTS